ncbi:MAG: hypothetical protein ACTSU5_19885 [Promethearchaeota archaeon]
MVQLKRTFPVHRGTVTCLSFDACGNVISGSTDKQLGRVDLEDETWNTWPTGHSRWITCLSLEEGSGIVVTGSLDGNVKLWRIPIGSGKPEIIQEFKAGGPVQALTINGGRALVGTRDGDLVSIPVSDESSTVDVIKVGDGGIGTLCAGEGGSDAYIGTFSGNIWHFDPIKPHPVKIQRFGSRGVTALEWIPGVGLLTGLDSGPILLWDFLAGSPKVVKRFRGFRSGCVSLACKTCTDGVPREFFASGLDGSVRLYDLSFEEPAAEVKLKKGFLTTLKYDPRRDILISGGNNTEVALWGLD